MAKKVKETGKHGETRERTGGWTKGGNKETKQTL